jgi:hypothetical protein
MNTTYTETTENKESALIGNGLAWILALLSPIATAIFTVLFRCNSGRVLLQIL